MIALPYLLNHLRLRRSLAFGLQFEEAAARALGFVGVKEDFHLGVRKHHGPDVTAFHHDVGPGAHIALLLD
jgi:hypothetical protein